MRSMNVHSEMHSHAAAPTPKSKKTATNMSTNLSKRDDSFIALASSKPCRVIGISARISPVVLRCQVCPSRDEDILP